MRFLETIRHFICVFLSFITGGTSCIGCSETVFFIPLCKKCRSKLSKFLPYDSIKRCLLCGKKLVSEINVCTECASKLAESSCSDICEYRKKFSFLDGLFPLHMYRLWHKDLVFNWKTKGERNLSYFFAELVNNGIKMMENALGYKFDSIIPVPPRPGKLRKKGWDQMEDIACILRNKYGFRIEKVLERLSSQEQKKLTKEQRKGINGAVYRFKEGAKLKGEKVLIIDDVITTGSTFEKCGKLVRDAGAKKVYGLSLFMVD